MQDLPAGFDETELLFALLEGWGITVNSLDHVTLGFGSYHWIAIDEDQQRFFVTVDDLDHKSWLGATRDSAFVGLQGAFETALDLRDRCGLQFVVAPVPAIGGETVRRIGRHLTVALFPFVEGGSGRFGDNTSSRHRGEVVRMLVDLHQATPAALRLARPLDLDFAGRRELEAARTAVDRAWTGGPFAEPARAWLAGHAGDLGRLLTDFDGLVGAVAAREQARVITHGEPHPGNVMHSHDGLLLIDWDTVGLALPERDLWLVATASGDEVALYADATGHEVSAAAMSLFRQAWELTDIAVYVALFRAPHEHTQDTERAWLNLEGAFRVEH